MGAVAYTTTLARRDVYLGEREREMREMRDVPHLERAEIREIFAGWGFTGAELEDIVDRIIGKPKAWLELMMAHELSLAPVDAGQARRSALLVGLAAMLGSLIPLAPFFFVGTAILWGIVISLAVSALALFAIGWSKARSTVGRPVRSGGQMVLIGIASAIAGFAAAYVVGLLYV